MEDENGNVLNVDYEEFHWTNGRELERIDYHMLNDNRIVYASYTYDENGIRTSKTRDDYTTKYIYDGDKLLAEFEEYTVNGTCWHCKEYLYDGNDEMVGYTCDNKLFFFLKDAEGDVIGLVDSSNGNVVEKYSYDPWGEISGLNHNLQRFNTICYRGYYYDEPENRYYLQSRYYKHQWGSFINADLPEIAQQSKNEVNGLNLFTYCNNDPINNVDPTGYSSNKKTTYVIYYGYGEHKLWLQARKACYHFNNPEYLYTKSNNDFINAWNSMYNIQDVYLYLHGGINKLYFRSENFNAFGRLKEKHVYGKVYLLSCQGGKTNKNNNSVAWSLANKSNSKVIACTGSVSYNIVNNYYGKSGYRARVSLKNYGSWYCYYYNKGKRCKYFVSALWL